MCQSVQEWARLGFVERNNLFWLRLEADFRVGRSNDQFLAEWRSISISFSPLKQGFASWHESDQSLYVIVQVYGRDYVPRKIVLVLDQED